MPRLEAFFTHGDGPEFCAGPNAPDDTKPSVQEAPDAPDRGVLYLHGPADSGQTSLLLQFGFTQIKAGKSVALILCGDSGASQQPAAAALVPLSACGKCGLPVQTGEDNAAWSSIHIKYARTSSELQHFLCSLHVEAKGTSVLLVGSLEKFFSDQSHMGNVYQTLAYLLEAREYMETSTGTGVVVVTGNTDSFFLRDRPLLRRWCKFLEIKAESEPGTFVLREEEEVGGSLVGIPQTQVQFEFSPDSAGNGVFQLLHVLRPTGGGVCM